MTVTSLYIEEVYYCLIYLMDFILQMKKRDKPLILEIERK
jgi:hypothetical protein